MTRILAIMLVWSFAGSVRADDPRPDLAFADISDPNPGSGRGQIIAGWVATGIGLAGIAQVPICRYDEFDDARELRRCRRVGLAFGIIGLAAGIPWLVFGYQKRAAQREWKKRHGLAMLPNFEFTGDSLRLDYRF